MPQQKCTFPDLPDLAGLLRAEPFLSVSPSLQSYEHVLACDAFLQLISPVQAGALRVKILAECDSTVFLPQIALVTSKHGNAKFILVPMLSL